MHYAFGAGLLFAAFLVLSMGRLALNRPGVTHSTEDFGAAEAIAFVFAAAAGFGAIQILLTLFFQRNLSGTVDMMIAVGAAVAACIALHFLLKQLFPRRSVEQPGRPVGPDIPFDPRRGRTDGARTSQAGRKGQKRAA